MTKKKKQDIPAIEFELQIDGKPVEVKAKPYITANDKQRFRVSYNGSPIHIFGVDDNTNKMQVLDSAAQHIPTHIEQAIANKLAA